MKAFNGLKVSEIRKIEKFAQLRDHKDSRLTSYGYGLPNDLGFLTVKCEICSNDMQDREDDVIMHVCLFDRRRSFVCNDY